LLAASPGLGMPRLEAVKEMTLGLPAIAVFYTLQAGDYPFFEKRSRYLTSPVVLAFALSLIVILPVSAALKSAPSEVLISKEVTLRASRIR
jgi:hypothetical protein